MFGSEPTHLEGHAFLELQQYLGKNPRTGIPGHFSAIHKYSTQQPNWNTELCQRTSGSTGSGLRLVIVLGIALGWFRSSLGGRDLYEDP